MKKVNSLQMKDLWIVSKIKGFAFFLYISLLSQTLIQIPRYFSHPSIRPLSSAYMGVGLRSQHAGYSRRLFLQQCFLVPLGGSWGIPQQDELLTLWKIPTYNNSNESWVSPGAFFQLDVPRKLSKGGVCSRRHSNQVPCIHNLILLATTQSS